MKLRKSTSLIVVILAILTVGGIAPVVHAQTKKSGSIGLEGKINAPPPTRGATITFPTNGTVITNLPTNVTGTCPTGLLVKIFRNNVFAGAVQCINGSFSIPIDLFGGRNELVARVFDDLDQPGPDSNTIVVSFPVSEGVTAISRISLTSSFAKKGANPGDTLTWPITITGGNGPYAITIDWGDGTTSDILSQQFAGTFDISHIYKKAGIYNVIIRATDKDGTIAFLQLVGIANGEAGQNTGGTSGNSGSDGSTIVQTKVLWQPALISIPLIIAAFWLGRKHELFKLRKRLNQSQNI